jgi:DNA-binding transcriptional regulator YiaG
MNQVDQQTPTKATRQPSLKGKGMNQVDQQATIKAIRQHHGMTGQDLADMAGVPLRIEYLMEIGCPVSQNDATKVMQALLALTNGHSSPKAVARPR